MGACARSRARRNGTHDGPSDDGFAGMAALGALGAAGTFLVACLLILFAWPMAAKAREKGFVAAAKERARESMAALRTLTLPGFVARVAYRLREEGVDASVENGGTRLVLAPGTTQFVRGGALPSKDARGDFEAFSRALAWGMSCYVDRDSRSTESGGACGSAPRVRCEPGFAPFSFRGIAFEGHADAVAFRRPSSTRNNATLSEARALAVKERVEGCLGAGAGPLLLQPRGEGTTTPRVAPPEAAGNRRVEIQFLE